MRPQGRQTSLEESDSSPNALNYSKFVLWVFMDVMKAKKTFCRVLLYRKALHDAIDVETSRVTWRRNVTRPLTAADLARARQLSPASIESLK